MFIVNFDALLLLFVSLFELHLEVPYLFIFGVYLRPQLSNLLLLVFVFDWQWLAWFDIAGIDTWFFVQWGLQWSILAASVLFCRGLPLLFQSLNFLRQWGILQFLVFQSLWDGTVLLLELFHLVLAVLLVLSIFCLEDSAVLVRLCNDISLFAIFLYDVRWGGPYLRLVHLPILALVALARNGAIQTPVDCADDLGRWLFAALLIALSQAFLFLTLQLPNLALQVLNNLIFLDV